MKASKLLAVLTALMLVLAACTSDSGGNETTTTTAADSGDSGGDTTTTTAAPVDNGDSGTSLLDEVIARDELNCGTRDALPGFAVLDDSGEHVGFDSDFCRVIAAAVLGDATKVNHVDLETADRFTALQSGQIDVLVRNTTFTASRDGQEGATFLQPNFYDGQGMMVSSDSGYTSVSDLDGVVVCVAKGTTTEGNAATESDRLGLNWEVRPFDDTDLIQEAFLAGQCDGWSSDVSQLTGLRSVYPDGPEALTILPEVFSKEPLAPAVADGDTAWAQVVNWAVYATIQAEEFGITSANVDDMLASSEDLNIKRFLGAEFETDGAMTVLDPGLGLPTDFAYQVVKQVGNYAEIFERNLTPLGLERGVNA
ncbi:MAG: amino acid ABC transporter substrate-binding protein, partial [Acidimicrobiia bacterium]